MTDVTDDIQAIYNLLGEWLAEYDTISKTKETGLKIVHIKVLRYTLEYAPDLPPTNTGSLRGRAAIIRDIQRCKDREALSTLAKLYYETLILPIKATGGKTQQPTEHSSRDSDEEARTANQIILEEAKRDQKRMKELALERDEGRCILSRAIHEPAYDAHPELYPDATTVGTEFLILAHILPFSLNKCGTKAAALTTSAIWSIITMFSGIELVEVTGDEINRIENVLMLTSRVHTYFGRLDIWFEPVVGHSNRYKLKKARPNSLLNVQEGIEFDLINHSPREDLLVPDPRYIQFHAACCKIAHASGAVEIIDEFLSDYETLKTLATDGSSHGVLDQAFLLAGAPIIVQ